MADEKDMTVYYDGACPLCSAEIGLYGSREGGDRICFLNVAENETDTGADLDKDQALKRFHVRLADGTLLSGARAFIEVWRTLPGWRWLARIASLPGIPTLLEGLYRIFLPIRPMLSRIARLFGAKPHTNP